MKTRTEPRSVLDNVDLGSEEEDESVVTVRCPECGSLLTYINLRDEGPVRRRFYCRKCRNRLLVLVNPFMVQHATSESRRLSHTTL